MGKHPHHSLWTARWLLQFLNFADAFHQFQAECHCLYSGTTELEYMNLYTLIRMMTPKTSCAICHWFKCLAVIHWAKELPCFLVVYIIVTNAATLIHLAIANSIKKFLPRWGWNPNVLVARLHCFKCHCLPPLGHSTGSRVWFQLPSANLETSFDVEKTINRSSVNIHTHYEQPDDCFSSWTSQIFFISFKCHYIFIQEP